MLSIARNRPNWTTTNEQPFQVELQGDGLVFVTEQGARHNQTRIELYKGVSVLLDAHHGARLAPAATVVNEAYLTPIFLAAVDPPVPSIEVTKAHVLAAFVQREWPRHRLLWLAAAMDWGRPPAHLEGSTGQARKAALKRMYPGGSTSSTDWWLISDAVCKRDGWRCNACKSEDDPLDVDHIHSLSRGGTNDPSNLWALCGPCHEIKTRMSKRVNWTEVKDAPKVRSHVLGQAHDRGDAEGGSVTRRPIVSNSAGDSASVPDVASTHTPPVRRHFRNELEVEDRATWDRLRARRLHLARAEKVPAYVIFNDATLARMVRAKPTTPEELLNIPGVGKAKVARYAQHFLPLFDSKSRA